MKANRQAKTDQRRMLQVSTVDGPLHVPVEIRRNRRSRYIRLWIGDHDQVVLSVPWHTAYKEALAFMETQGDWIARQFKQAPRKLRLIDFLREEQYVTVGGVRRSLQFHFAGQRTRIVYEPGESKVHIHANPRAETEHALYRAVRTLAKQVLTERTQALARQVQADSIRVVVRNQRSRWGSCSGRREISLNWRLLFLSPELQDYVILHELAHLVEMNHSPRFWALLNTYDPRARHHDRMLQRAGRTLMPVARGLD